MSWSPWRTTSWYCLFLSSGRFVSMTPLPLTRSMVQGMRPAAMNLARSLEDFGQIMFGGGVGRRGSSSSSVWYKRTGRGSRS